MKSLEYSLDPLLVFPFKQLNVHYYLQHFFSFVIVHQSTPNSDPVPTVHRVLSVLYNYIPTVNQWLYCKVKMIRWSISQTTEINKSATITFSKFTSTCIAHVNHIFSSKDIYNSRFPVMEWVEHKLLKKILMKFGMVVKCFCDKVVFVPLILSQKTESWSDGGPQVPSWDIHVLYSCI